MPKRISQKDKKQIYCAYRLGENNGKTRYTEEVHTLECQFTKLNGVKQVNYYGTEMSFNATAIFENTEKNRYIDKFTKFWLSTKPENGNVSAEYKVVGLSDEVDGVIIVWLNSVVQNHTDLWYLSEDNLIYQINVMYDFDTNKAIIPKNMYCPIEPHTKVWDVDPEDNPNATEGLMYLTFKELRNNGVLLQFEPKDGE